MRISVIIPCYNVAPFIRDCVDSVIAQNISGIQLICVNDGSTDDTQVVLEKIKASNAIDLILIDQKNSGASSARNNGLKEASGEYIQFLDADDVLLKGKLQNQIDRITAEKKLPDLIVGDYVKKNLNGKETIIAANKNDSWMGLMQTRLGCTCSNLWKKKIVDEAGGFDVEQKSSQEYDLMFRLLKNGASVIFDDRPLTFVNERREGSISFSDRASSWKRYTQLRCDIISYLRSIGKLTSSNEDSFYQVLFDAIRNWYPYSKKEASEFYSKYIPKDFKPQVSTATSANYIRLYRILGFKWTESIKQAFKSAN